MATPFTERAAVLRSRDFLGTDVIGIEGDKVGSIRDLLLDRRNGTVRFVELDRGMRKHNVLVPIRFIDWKEEAFQLRYWTEDELSRLPSYDAKGSLTGEMLDELALAYPRVYGDAVGEEPPIRHAPRVVRLGDASDFKLDRDAPDLRGWAVFGSDGDRVGEVDDLLLDSSGTRIAYLVVDVMDDLFLFDDDRHVVVPLSAVELRERSKDAWVRGPTAREVARLPAYHAGAVDPFVYEITDQAFG